CQEKEHLLRREASLRVAQVASLLALFLPAVFALAFMHFAWLALPAAAFVALLYWQRRARRAIARNGYLIEYYRRGLDRLEGHRAGRGDLGLDLEPPGHPYALDLDLFGVGSLFERLSTARTRAGAQTLAAWLLSPASAEEIRSRQQAIDDLRGRLDLREDLYLLGTQVPANIDLDGLVRWSKAPSVLPSRARAAGMYVLAMLAA